MSAKSASEAFAFISALMTILASTSKLIPYGSYYTEMHTLFNQQYCIVWGLGGWGNTMRIIVGGAELTAGILLFTGGWERTCLTAAAADSLGIAQHLAPPRTSRPHRLLVAWS